MTLLVLAGTAQAQDLARALSERGTPAVASLAGATRAPKPMALPTRSGGFGGDDGFRAYLAKAGITAVLDATHPFASQISQRSADICADLDLPYCQLLRPAWQPQSGDDWTMVDHAQEAAQHIAPGSTVFLATGRQTLMDFANLPGCHLVCRQIDPPDTPFPFENGQFLIGRPPFSVADECETFRRLGVDWLAVKNAGGTASATKLTAARELGVKVLMINRPSQPSGVCRVTTVQDALDWVAAL